MVRWDRSINQVWIFGQRVHHGAVGVLLIATAMSQRTLCASPLGRAGVAAAMAAGIVLCVDDLHDAPVWFKPGL